MPFFNKYFKKNIEYYMSTLLPRCSKHIAFTSPRIRFWIINLLLSINSFYSLKNEKVFMKNILPHICLNRYLQVEKKKKNTMILWKEITALGGIEYCSEHEYNTTHALVLGTYDDTKGKKLKVKVLTNNIAQKVVALQPFGQHYIPFQGKLYIRSVYEKSGRDGAKLYFPTQ